MKRLEHRWRWLWAGVAALLVSACAVDADPEADRTAAAAMQNTGAGQVTSLAIHSTAVAAGRFERQGCLHDGDVSGDGQVSAGDAQTAFFIALQLVTPTESQRCSADCNGDGTVSAGDAQMIFWTALEMGRCAAQRNGSVLGLGAGHLRGGSGQDHRMRIGIGLATPIGYSQPVGSGFSTDYGYYPTVKDF